MAKTDNPKPPAVLRRVPANTVEQDDRPADRTPGQGGDDMPSTTNAPFTALADQRGEGNPADGKPAPATFDLPPPDEADRAHGSRLPAPETEGEVVEKGEQAPGAVDLADPALPGPTVPEYDFPDELKPEARAAREGRVHRG